MLRDQAQAGVEGLALDGVSHRRALERLGSSILQLREWARANKVAVPARGRIPKSVVEQYRQAGGR